MTGNSGDEESTDPELGEVIAVMRAAGWRGSTEKLTYRAAERLAIARRHAEKGQHYRDAALRFDEFELRRFDEERALRHDVRAAVLMGRLTRPERNIALLILPGLVGGSDELLDAARAILAAPEP